jgi:hypothetical protein
MDFEQLTPDQILNAAEEATGTFFTGFTAQLPSYINRVYELQTRDGLKIIAKFYRPGRWSKDAILNEHTFLQELYEAELRSSPLQNSLTERLWEFMIRFTSPFFLKSWETVGINSFEDWLRLGTMVARIHNIGRYTMQNPGSCSHQSDPPVTIWIISKTSSLNPIIAGTKNWVTN